MPHRHRSHISKSGQTRHPPTAGCHPQEWSLSSLCHGKHRYPQPCSPRDKVPVLKAPAHQPPSKHTIRELTLSKNLQCRKRRLKVWRKRGRRQAWSAAAPLLSLGWALGYAASNPGSGNNLPTVLAEKSVHDTHEIFCVNYSAYWKFLWVKTCTFDGTTWLKIYALIGLHWAQLHLHDGSTQRIKVSNCISTLFISSKSSVTCWQDWWCLEIICSVASGEEEITLNTCNQLINKVDQKLDTISPMILYL